MWQTSIMAPHSIVDLEANRKKRLGSISPDLPTPICDIQWNGKGRTTKLVGQNMVALGKVIDGTGPKGEQFYRTSVHIEPFVSQHVRHLSSTSTSTFTFTLSIGRA